MLLDAAVPETLPPSPGASGFDRAIRVLWPIAAVVLAVSWLYIGHRQGGTKLDWWGVKLVDSIGHRDRSGAGIASDLRSLGSPTITFVGLLVIAAVTSTQRRLAIPAVVLCSAAGFAALLNDLYLQKHATRVVAWPLIWNGVDHFPSGHSVGASALAFTTVGLCRLAGMRGVRFAVVTACAIGVAAMVAWANVATYAHMPTSAAAGPLVSLACVGAAYDVVSRLASRRPRRP
ncbi:MAG: hypothetical protein AB7L13_01960 [Acidimicrobiia bacterium]